MIQSKNKIKEEKEQRNDSLYQLGQYFYQLSLVIYAGGLLAVAIGGYNKVVIGLCAILMVSFAIMGFTTIYWSNHYKH